MGHEVSADDLQARNQNGHFQREVCLQLRLQMLGPAAWRNLTTVAICWVPSSRVLLQGKILGGLLAASASKHLGTLAALLGGFLGEIGLKRIS